MKSLVFMLPIKLPSVNNSQYFVSAHVSYQEYSTVYQDQFHVRRCWSSPSHPDVRESFCPTHINKSMVLSGPRGQCVCLSALDGQLETLLYWASNLSVVLGQQFSTLPLFVPCGIQFSRFLQIQRANCFPAVEVRQLFVHCVKDLHLALLFRQFHMYY
jgi:hypothetical protein